MKCVGCYESNCHLTAGHLPNALHLVHSSTLALLQALLSHLQPAQDFCTAYIAAMGEDRASS
jgi:hypothetical protein